ncbi:MAG: methylase [Anaerolineae bacterium]
MSARRHPLAPPKHPLGQPTRGKTARNRLRRVDNFLTLYDPGLLRRVDGPYDGAFFVDLGYGAEPITTLESAQRLRRINPVLPVLGVEIDPERVASAQPYADDLTHFRLGGFNLPLRSQADGSQETVRAIRAFNVLRQYEEGAVAAAWQAMGSSLLPGGLLIEGTSEPYGRVWVANVLRRSPHPGPLPGGEGVRPHPCPLPGGEGAGMRYEGLLFSTNFRLGFDPAQFQAVLPKNLIHRMTPGEPIYALMEAWQRAARETMAARVWGPRQWFTATAHRLAALGYPVALRRKLLAGGYLLVRRF